MIRKVVIPAAGIGSRLVPATKEQPKEMLPIFAGDANGEPCLKPLLQLIFEQLYDAGFREFCFVVGRGKRAIEDHFTPDHDFISTLMSKGKTRLARSLEEFYSKIEKSKIIWINQPKPMGFGDAVLKAQSFVGDEEFLIHAGDTYIISNNNQHLKSLIDIHERLNSDVTFIVHEVDDPRKYGIIEGDEVDESIYRVMRVEEKPEVPPTNLAIMPVYIFHPVIFKALEVTPLGKGGELQLTDGIQKLIDWKLKIHAVKLSQKDTVLDIGTPQTYWEALQLSYSLLVNRK